jgi:hypothetical protein
MNPNRDLAISFRIVSDAKSTSMSMMGFAARSGTAVLPTCSMAAALVFDSFQSCGLSPVQSAGAGGLGSSRGVILVLRVTVRRARPFNFRVVMPSALLRMVIVSLNSGVLCGSSLATGFLQVVCFQW